MASKNGWLWAVGLSLVLGPPALMRTKSAPAEEPAPQPQAEAEAAPAQEAAPAPEGALKGNVKSKSFHQPGCRYYDSPDCTAVFAERQEALDAGYKPCKVCKP
ncbi:MAG: hypothetical protein KQH53_16635 [Desulfarculaceae bacterium]|nr:hypothetical protein [Desulfarculaceae bacterium]